MTTPIDDLPAGQPQISDGSDIVDQREAAETAAVPAAARVVAAASTSAASRPEVNSASDTASPSRRQDRNIGTAYTPLSETIIGILAEKP